MTERKWKKENRLSKFWFLFKLYRRNAWGVRLSATTAWECSK
jgi:hypothetical protein